jgi:hypothetical protein
VRAGRQARPPDATSAAAAASAARPPPSQWVDDMVAGLKSGLGQKIAQIPGRLQAAVVKKAPMRQQPRTPQVTAAGIASEILARELARSSGIEDRDVPTGLQGLPVDKSDGSGRRPCPECRWVRGSTALPNRSSPPRIADHPQFNMTASPPRYCRMNQTRAASVMRPSS